MITRMKKLTLLIYHKEYEAFLTQMQQLGVLHVQAAGAALALPVAVHAGLLAVMLGWLALAAWQCRRSLRTPRA